MLMRIKIINKMLIEIMMKNYPCFSPLQIRIYNVKGQSHEMDQALVGMMQSSRPS